MRNLSLVAICLTASADCLTFGQGHSQPERARNRITFIQNPPTQFVDRRIGVVRLGERSIGTLTDELPYRFQPEHALVVSPDGKQAAYLTDGEFPPEGGLVTYSIFLRALQDRKSNGTSLKFKAHSIQAWSGDGTKLLVGVWEAGDTQAQYIFELRTNKAIKLVLAKPTLPAGAAYITEPHVSDWSRDGKWFIATCSFGKDANTNKPGLFLFRSDGSTIRHLDDVAYGVAGTFSPDGQRILFSGKYDANGAEVAQYFVAELRGGKPMRVTQEIDGVFWGRCWSPDGKRIAYLWYNRQDGEQAETFLMAVDADGSNPELLASQKGRNVWWHSPNWR